MASVTLPAEKMLPDDALELVLSLLVPVVAQEEEFVGTFFHMKEEVTDEGRQSFA